MLGVFIEQPPWPRKTLYLIGVYLCLKFKSVARYVTSVRYLNSNFSWEHEKIVNPNPRKDSNRLELMKTRLFAFQVSSVPIHFLVFLLTRKTGLDFLATTRRTP
jgi:hypothetical protein